MRVLLRNTEDTEAAESIPFLGSPLIAFDISCSVGSVISVFRTF
jgi:hypothetical protein